MRAEFVGKPVHGKVELHFALIPVAARRQIESSKHKYRGEALKTCQRGDKNYAVFMSTIAVSIVHPASSNALSPRQTTCSPPLVWVRDETPRKPRTVFMWLQVQFRSPHPPISYAGPVLLRSPCVPLWLKTLNNTGIVKQASEVLPHIDYHEARYDNAPNSHRNCGYIMGLPDAKRYWWPLATIALNAHPFPEGGHRR